MAEKHLHGMASVLEAQGLKQLKVRHQLVEIAQCIRVLALICATLCSVRIPLQLVQASLEFVLEGRAQPD